MAPAHGSHVFSFMFWESFEVISLFDCTLDDLHFAINAMKVDPKARRENSLGVRKESPKKIKRKPKKGVSCVWFWYLKHSQDRWISVDYIV